MCVLVVSVWVGDMSATKGKKHASGDGDNGENVKFSTHRYPLRRKDFSCYNCCRADG
jgi:hypothetical protein